MIGPGGAILTRWLACGMVSAGLVGAAIAPVAAQGGPTVRVRGEITAFDGQLLRVEGRDGTEWQVRLADDYTVNAVVPAALASIRSGTYIGTAAQPQRDGTLRAIEVLVFPEAMRGVGEGHRGWDLTPESTMTNAAVTSVVAGVEGRVLMLRHKDGEHRVTVPPDAPIVAFEPGDRSLVRPGNHVFATATRQPDGSLVAARLAIGRNGLVPPM